MISGRDEEIINAIVNDNVVVGVAAAYTVYEQMCPKKPISKRDFLREFDDNFHAFRRIFDERIEEER